jgi:hypothetical protein
MPFVPGILAVGRGLLGAVVAIETVENGHDVVQKG